MRHVVLILTAMLLFITSSQSLDNNDDLIIGGDTADIDEFPFIVSFQILFEHKCGGSLLSTTHVLTACHCVVTTIKGHDELLLSDVNEITLLAGTANLKKNTGQRRKVHTLLKYPKCEDTKQGWIFDYGMVIVSEKFPIIRGQIEVLPLPNFTNKSLETLSEKGTDCVTAGWGITDEKSKKASTILLRVDLRMISNAECSKRITETAEIVLSDLRFTNSCQLCTLGEDDKDGCTGDSGGPLLCEYGSGTRILCAIVSWGIGCGRPGVPGVWARTDIAEPWIRSTLTQRYGKREVIKEKDTNMNEKPLGSTAVRGSAYQYFMLLTSITLLIPNIKDLYRFHPS